MSDQQDGAVNDNDNQDQDGDGYAFVPSLIRKRLQPKKIKPPTLGELAVMMEAAGFVLNETGIDNVIEAVGMERAMQLFARVPMNGEEGEPDL